MTPNTLFSRHKNGFYTGKHVSLLVGSTIPPQHDNKHTKVAAPSCTKYLEIVQGSKKKKKYLLSTFSTHNVRHVKSFNTGRIILHNNSDCFHKNSVRFDSVDGHYVHTYEN